MDKSEKDFFYFLKLLSPQHVVLDIGANLGLMSFHLCKKVKTVHAIEPMPHNLKNLEKLKSVYGLVNLTIHSIALGDHSGTIELVMPVVDGVRKQGLSHVLHEKMEVFNEGDIHRSELYKLDEYSPLTGTKVDAIKIDVENFEYEAFCGGIELLKRDKPLIYCELWDNKNRYDCFSLLKDIGYDIFCLNRNELVKFEGSGIMTQNFFFIHSQN